MTAGPAAVRVQGLVKRYGDRRVVDDVTFEIAAGEAFALLGPNGAGKTTTVEILEGYRRRDGGTVSVLGADPARAGSAHRARVGLMLQGGGLEPRATPVEILRLYARFHAQPRDPDELLDLVGLRTVARSRYRRLSGGERQRLGLAVALVGRPELIVLDEPTAGMDPAAKAATRDLVSDLRSSGVTILLTTHDLLDVERMADRVAILHRGRIVAIDAPARLVAGGEARLSVRFARSLASGELAGLQASIAAIAQGAAVLAEEGGAGVLVEGVAPDPRLVATVAGWAAGRGLLIVELTTRAGSLEDRYLELTGDAGTGDHGVAAT